jgi:trigger factor
VRDRKFRFEVRAVKERDLPDLDDELAKDLGDFETLAEMREAVRHRLSHEKRAERSEQRERALLDQLRERHPIALPQGLVQEEVEKLVREYAENLARQGVDVEHAEIDWQAMADQARPSAEKRVHARLLLDAVARQEELAVEEAELERTLAELARVQRTTSGAVRRALDQDGGLGRLRSQLLRSKTLRHLLGEEPAAPDEAAAEAAEEAGESNPSAPDDVESATGE